MTPTHIERTNGHIVCRSGPDPAIIFLDLGAVLRVQQYATFGDLTPQQAAALGGYLTAWATKPHHNRRSTSRRNEEDALLAALNLERIG